MFPIDSNLTSSLISSNIARCTSLSPPIPNLAPPTSSISSLKMRQTFFVWGISNSSRTSPQRVTEITHCRLLVRAASFRYEEGRSALPWAAQCRG
ncbi:hypothetical protein PFISCL1PPCAC_15476 [Pristionchus fissidentatus]|uniref:Uncharacterized protein n=1 Tax=Pristionchus fissidentatus TaxID=1538716 RepID=A0AAV5VIY1_9BILA|nr:hypothetical protein PFISCL1PPCAC_9036 [Pristionchus fissidentatus]GMT24179.1 hypothetical protein PFISCL1PPCAC_15476 [Pristionchus fissidentatus]